MEKRMWHMIDNGCVNNLAKIQVCAVFHLRVIWQQKNSAQIYS